MTKVKKSSSIMIAVLLALSFLSIFPLVLQGQAILTTLGDKNQIIYFPAPSMDLPTPEQYVIPELPSTARPQGLTYAGTDSAMVADFNNSRIFLIDLLGRGIYATLDTSSVGYTGTGTLAGSPDGKYVLACGAASVNETVSTLYVIPAPFTDPAKILKVLLTGSVKQGQTQSIVFSAAGQAFVYHTGGISVLNPPYTSVAFVMPVPATSKGGSLAMTPDGSILFATSLGANLYVYGAPFSAQSTAMVYSPLTLVSPGLSGIMVSPDGSCAIIACAKAPKVYTFSAPFNDSSLMQEIPLPSSITLHPDWGFEDVGISADGSLAILTGNSPSPEFSFPACFIRAPFSAQQASVFAVNIPNGGNGGRGSGAVRFLPPGMAPGLSLTGSLAVNRSTLTYTLNFSNTGSNPVTRPVLRFPLPEGTVFVSCTGGGKVESGVVVWNLNDMGLNSSNNVTLTLRMTGTSPLKPVVYTIQGADSPMVAGTPINNRLYYFPHLAANSPEKWTSTLTYVNPASQPVQCTTRFWNDSGLFLSLEFNDTKGASITNRTDEIVPNGILRVTTVLNPALPLQTGWVQCECSGEIKASLLYRSHVYNQQDPPQLIPSAEVGFSGQLNGSTHFVTFAESWTGIAMANPFTDRSQVTLSLRDKAGAPIQAKSFILESGYHTAIRLKDFFELDSFYGSMAITSSKPILNLNINGEAVNVFSALPPGED